MQIKTTGADHIPEEFTVEDLKASGFTDGEIALLAQGDENNPALVTLEDDPGDDDGAQQQAAEIGTPPQDPPPAQQQPQQEARIPQVQIPDTKEAEAIVAALDTKLEELQQRYDEGDLTRAEMLAQQKAIIAEQAKAQTLIDQAAQVITQTKQTIEQQWYGALDAYKANGTGDLWSDGHVQNWDRHLREVTANPALQNLTFDQMIRLAHSRYAQEYEVINGKALPIQLPKTAQAAKLNPRNPDERPEPPQTLANINSDLSDAISDSRAAALDKLASTNPLQAEAQLKQMSPDEEARWLMGA